ncbi:MAG: hypothetical protein GY952_06760 [Rhodobacteraceae bacterium]|nr:hypothetical protein [Paracoccaceae bacterium]
MAAETLTTTQAAATQPVYRPAGGGALGFTYGVYEIAAVVEDGDIFQMCRVPAGATVVEGFVRADDIDTGTEALDMDVGWAANGSDAADPDGFGNLGTWTGDAVTDIKPEVQIWYPFNGVLKDGPKTFVNETIIQVEANTASNAGHVGTLYVGVFYISP